MPDRFRQRWAEPTAYADRHGAADKAWRTLRSSGWHCSRGAGQPIDRVASFRRIPSWPERRALTQRPYMTAGNPRGTRLQPHRSPNDGSLGHLREESIHDWLGLGRTLIGANGELQKIFPVILGIV